MKKSNIQNSGFTIIETLVAITVLMIAVAGPLVVASKGLNAALYARDQVIATYLAQESMEVIKNTRDNNLNLGNNWLANIQLCTSANAPTCDASAVSLNTTQSGSVGGYAITFDSGSGYVSNGSGSTPTIFKRYYYLAGPGGNGACVGSVGTECEAHIVVTWNEGKVPYEVDLNSELVNNQR
jgi:type II secretory pathway pseudopilin PulG